ncbi:MAG TPA: GAF domain-containing protein [Gaiellaceae bacterium]|nr:GAF domain-containing protein [Gaiellaceae bacterium]
MAGEVPSVLEQPFRTELLHESDRTRISRVYVPGGSVIRKEPLGPGAESRLRHERSFLERLRGVEGIVQLEGLPRYPGSIVLTDTGATDLAAHAKPLPAPELIELALAVARAVERMHDRGVMHRDISPANIIVTEAGGPCLVDFALATSLAELRPLFTHQSEIVGTLAYLAPEQTGRTARPADQRADLYALGATLYELATGEPPFSSREPLQLIHDHLTCVPTAAAARNPAVPAAFSDIVMHLLEKEPDDRYQTAAGVVHDLERLRDAGGAPATVRVGERDVSPRLMPPSHLIGREAEVAALEAAFEQALVGRCRVVLVGGAPGVGKTALADELRPVVTARNGWFVAGKYDQYRRDSQLHGINQAFRALGRMVLAEPEDELAAFRERILVAVGPNAGLLTAMLPEFAALLAVAPDPGDPLTAQARAQRTAADVLRALASPKRPLVLFVDDLQWAGRTALGFFDLLLGDDPIAGVLLVTAYRDDDVGPTHPLSAPLARWRVQPAVRHLRLDNLLAPHVAAVLAEMLNVDLGAAGALADRLEPHTRGNPYETLELLDTLRHEGVLEATAGGWRWDDPALRGVLRRTDVGRLVAARVEEMPAASRQLVEAMACLGGRAELTMLQAAVDEPAGAVELRLAPALERGILVVEPGAHEAVRFRHDRIRDEILRLLDPQRRHDLQLAIARRLANVPEHLAVAAEQFLSVLTSVDDAERPRVVALLRAAAEQAALSGDFATVEAFVTAALSLIDSVDTATLAELHTARHRALFSLGRLEEADAEYAKLVRLRRSAVEQAHPTAVQVRALTQRNVLAEAVGLGVGSLGELGVAVPDAERLDSEVDRHLDHVYRWIGTTSLADDLARPEIDDPKLAAAARLINALTPAAHFGGERGLLSWLTLEAARIWLDHGSARTLLGPMIMTCYPLVTLRDDYAAVEEVVRRIVALGEAGGFEPETGQVRYLGAIVGCWFEPIEDGVAAARKAREGLIAGGDLANAGYSYLPAFAGVLDSAASLESWNAELDSGLVFAERTGNQQVRDSLASYRLLNDLLRGQTTAMATSAVPIDAVNPMMRLLAHVHRGVAAAIFGDLDALSRHAKAALPLLPTTLGYAAAQARLLRALALASEARAAAGDEEPRDSLRELDELIGWHAARAAGAPANFGHLLRFLEAERAWAVGDFEGAARAFDVARRAAAERRRPWHRALINERAGRLYLAYGLDRAGLDLLGQAREDYKAWGASAKVAQLDWAYPGLDGQSAAGAGENGVGAISDRRSAVTTGTIDLHGVLSASQALSSETTVARLHARISQVLSSLTGATSVRLLLWAEAHNDWLLPAADAGATIIGATGTETAEPMSVVRYVQRTGEPLVVADALADDRFARDPYFAGVDRCSLLALPIVSRGSLQAVLLVENRLIRDAFSAERLEAVKLIGGQLAVSLDNARVNADFRRVADEQTALRRVATLVARGEPAGEVFDAVAEEVATVLGAEVGVVVRYEGETAFTGVGAWMTTGERPLVGQTISLGGYNTPTLVLETRRPARIDDYGIATGDMGAEGHQWRIGSSIGAPITVAGRLWGVMIVSSRRPNFFPPAIEDRLLDFTELVATAIANSQAREELRRVADEQAALRRVATLVARGEPPTGVFAAVAEEVGNLLPGVELALVGRYTPDRSIEFVGAWSGVGETEWLGERVPVGGRNVSTAVFESRQPARVDHLDDDATPATALARRSGARSSAGAPINLEGQLWGVIIVASVQEASLPSGLEHELAAFTDLIATAIANAESRGELSASRARIVATADETRRRIERDLHDGAQQQLVTLALQLRTAEKAVPPELAELRGKLDRAAVTTAETLEELREIAHGIHPGRLASGGLRPALKTLSRRAPMPVELELGVLDRFPEHVEVSAFYVVSEALTNAAKHANASAATVQVELVDGVLRISVSDDGVGGADLSRGTGLLGLKDRVEALGGRMVLDSPPGRGTTLHAELPLAGAAAPASGP